MGTLVELVLGRASGSKAALVAAEDGKAVSYDELASICVEFGRHLKKHCGLRKGDVVSIVLPRRCSLAQVVGTLGSMFAGLVAAPLNPTYKVDELEFFISDAEAKIVVVEAQNDSGKNAWVAATRLGLPVCGMTLEWLDDKKKPVLTMGSGVGGAAASSEGGGEASDSGESSVSPSDLALVLHTSGTTSRPKLVPLTHGNMHASVEAVVRHYGISEKDNTLIVQPLFHIGGLVTPLLSTLSVGGTVAIARMFDDSKHWQFVDRYDVSWFTAVPTIHKVLVANADRDFLKYQHFKNGTRPSLRFIRSGSAALPPDFLEKIETAFGAPLIESYGMTEAAQLICANPLPTDGPRYAGSVGICAGPEGKVFDATTGKPQTDFEDDGSCVGEMCIAGPSVMTGYARNAEANATSFLPDGEGKLFFRTGDLVARTKEGYYSIVGRIKEIINRAGEKIAPAKLDKVLAYENRKDSVVSFGIPDADFGQAVAAALVFDADAYPDDKDADFAEKKRRAELLLKKAMDKLAPHELPTTLYAITKDDVPKTATGKTRRIKCGELCVQDKEPLLKNGQWQSVIAETTTTTTTNNNGVKASLPAAADEETTEKKTAVSSSSSDVSALTASARERARQAIAEALITVGVPLAVDDDAPLMQSGLTSMMVFGFVKAVASSLELENQLPHMLVFDAPTPKALSADLADRVVRAKLKGTAAYDALGTPAALRTPSKSTNLVDVDVAGASWRLPGDLSAAAAKTLEPNPSAVRMLMDSLGDTRMEVPASRWSSESLEAAIGGPKAPNFQGIKERCAFGGFVGGLGALDHSYFGMSKNEASLCDPQQRMLLEHVTSAFGGKSAPEDAGVFVGISFHDWAQLTLWNAAAAPQMRKSVFASSGSFTSYASGRLSFALGLRGPCVSVNTACSSGLVALHGAFNAVATKDTSLSVAACSNAILDPTISINFAVKGITSPRGRCHTFDASADGYMRSEACLAVALGPRHQVDGEENGGDEEKSLNSSSLESSSSSSSDLGIGGIVVRHDGKSASLTAPNGSAQVAMLAATTKTRDFYEAHGTATPLGDPIEVGALARFVDRYDQSDRAIPLSGAKSAFGHGEAVAGAIGLLATMLALRQDDAAPNGALKKINPAVKADRGDVLTLATTDPLAIVKDVQAVSLTAGGVSSLGASGTIAHAVVEKRMSRASSPSVLLKPWPIFPNRVDLPWQPWEPPEKGGKAVVAPEPEGKKKSPSSVLAKVRGVCAGFVDSPEDLDDAEPLLDQGFDSLTAMELVSELQAAFSDSLELPQTLLVDCPSVADIAALVEKELGSAAAGDDADHQTTEEQEASEDKTPRAPLESSFPNTEGDDGPTVVVKKALTTPPSPLVAGEQIFFIHGVDGDPLAMLFHQVASELRFPSSTVRCIEKPKAECGTLEELASYYVARIKERQPRGKYRVFGHSFGALIAHQVALQLERNGDEVVALVLGDFEVTYPPSRSRGGDLETSTKGRFGLEEWEGGEIEAIKLACRRFGSATRTTEAFDPDAFRAKVLTGARDKGERRMRAMFHYMPAYMQRREWDRLLDLWERNMEFLHTVTVPKFGPKRRDTWQPDGVVRGPVLHLRALQSQEFAKAETLNAKYCANYTVRKLPGLHYTFLQKPHAAGVAGAIDDFIVVVQEASVSRETPTTTTTHFKEEEEDPPLVSSKNNNNNTNVAAAAFETLSGVVYAKGTSAQKDRPFVVSWARSSDVVETATFAEFAARCAATARRLRRTSTTERTAILSHATVAAHVAVVAVAAAGGAAVMLNPRLRVELLASMINRVDGCGTLICGLSLRPLAARVAPAVAALAASKTWILLPTTNSTSPSAFVSPTLDERHERPLDTTADASSSSEDLTILHDDAKRSRDDAVVVMFTSGTTAAPKPIALSSKQLLSAAARMRKYERSKGIAGENGTLSFLPLYHMMGLAHNFLANLASSSKLLVHASAPEMPLTLGLLLEAAPVLKPSAIESVAVVAENLGEMLKVGGELARDIRKRFESVKCLKVGGSKLPKRVVDDLVSHDLTVLEHYGQTELCGYVLAALTTPTTTKKTGTGGINADENVNNAVKEKTFTKMTTTQDDDDDVEKNEKEKSTTSSSSSRRGSVVIEATNMEPVGVRASLRGDNEALGELLIYGGGDDDAQAHATGDIFAATGPNKYTFKSRVDGMLVLGSGEMIEPTAIEHRILRDLARHVAACCLAGNGRARPALLVELRGSESPPSDDALEALTATLDAVNADLDATTSILPTHVVILDEETKLPTNLKGAVDHSAAAALFEDELAAIDTGTLVHSSLQAFNLGYGPKE